METAPERSRPVLTAVRRWFEVDVVVLAVVGVQCFLLSADTDRWFAWTVAPPLSAAVLGAGYLGSIVMVVEARRARRWVDARIVLVSTAVFATLTLVATLVHLDRFHLDEGRGSARAAGVVWLVVYVVVPPLVTYLAVRQHTAPGTDPPRAGPGLARWMRVLLAVEAVALVALATWMARGAAHAGWWPWRLSDLTARAIAAWLAALGWLIGFCAWEREIARVRGPLLSLATATVLWGVALVRYHESVRWGPGAVLVGILGVLAASVAVALVPAGWQPGTAPRTSASAA